MNTRRLLQISLLIGVLMASTIISVAQVGVVATVQRDLTLRVGAGTEWRTLEVMPAGTNVALDGRISDNTWVRGITQNGSVGWMFAAYLNVSATQISQLPVIAREASVTIGAPPPGSVPAQAPAGQAAVSAPVGNGTAATATVNVNMRSGPSTEYRRVGGLRTGEAINIDGRDPSVGWVRGINQAGTVGWVSAQYISLNADQVAALPIVDINAPFALGAPGGGTTTAQTAPAAMPVPPPVVSTAPISGFGYGGHVAGLDPTAVNYMRQAGMTWAKIQVRYAQGNDPSPVAGFINDAHAKGFRVLLGVVGAPDQVNNPGYFEAYAAYVGGLAALGADAIEIWNEPNLSREWPAGQIDPARYTQLLAMSYNAIKANNPNTWVISAAPAPTGAEAAFPGNVMNDDRYLAGMVAAGALNYMDCVGAHYNEGIVSPLQNSGDPRNPYYTRYYNGMVDTYWNIVNGRRPLCFTELGYLTPEGYPGLPPAFLWASETSVAEQAQWLGQVIRLARNRGRVRMVIVWNVNIFQYNDDPMGGFAIIRPDGSCPACATMGR